MKQLYSQILNTPQGKLYLYPDNWKAGDLSKYAHKGNGVYGYQKSGYADPIKNAPPQEAEGAVLFFEPPNTQDFQGMLRLLRVRTDSKKYALFMKEAENTMEEHYLTQLRIVSRFALQFMFSDITEEAYEALPDQDLTIGECLEYFMEEESKKCDSRPLSGKFGGDGDYAYEALCFGFMLENSYHAVYRIWSRAWLITK